MEDLAHPLVRRNQTEAVWVGRWLSTGTKPDDHFYDYACKIKHHQ